MCKTNKIRKTKPRVEYLSYCKSKAFLVSTSCHDIIPHDISNFKVRLELDSGAYVGYDASKKLTGFPEGKILGAGSICYQSDLGLSKDNETIWMDAFVEYGRQTKYGHLIMSGTVENFQKWAKSKASRVELSFERIFAYIEHTLGDAGGKKGFILPIEAKNKDGSATVRDGKGYIIYGNGNYYHGDIKIGFKNGKGKFVWTNGDEYKGEFSDNKMNGKGAFKWLCGDVYDGTWASGKKHGKGYYTFAKTGEVKIGEFKKDELVRWL